MLAHDPANRPSAAELLAGGAFAVPESPHEMSPSERLEISFPGGVNQSEDHAGDMEED